MVNGIILKLFCHGEKVTMTILGRSFISIQYVPSSYVYLITRLSESAIVQWLDWL